MYDLSKRYETFFMEEGYEKTVTLHEDGYTIALTSNRLPAHGTYSEIYLRKNYNRFNEYGYIIQYYNNGNNLFVGNYNKHFHRGDKSVYAKKTWNSVIKYDFAKKELRITKFLNDDLIKVFLKYLGSESILDESNCMEAWLNQRVLLKKIIQGKITNRKDALTHAVKASFKADIGDYKLVNNFIHKFSYSQLGQFIYNTTDHIQAIKQYEKYNEEQKEIFWDLLENAAVLQVKINPKWSLKRMQQEHEKMVEEITLKTVETLHDDNIYGNEEKGLVIDDKKVKGHVLSTERDAYMEGSIMHHCIYTNYFESIRKKTYFALSLESPCRCTVGLNVMETTDDNTNRNFRFLSLNQMYMSHNRNIEEKDKHIIREWLDKNLNRYDHLFNTKEEFKEIRNKPFENINYLNGHMLTAPNQIVFHTDDDYEMPY